MHVVVRKVADSSAHADLIAKGAVLRKGERLRSRFCKFVKGASANRLQSEHGLS